MASKIRNNSCNQKSGPMELLRIRDAKEVQDWRGKWFPVVKFNQVTVTVKNGRADWSGEHTEKIKISEIKDFR